MNGERMCHYTYTRLQIFLIWKIKLINCKELICMIPYLLPKKYLYTRTDFRCFSVKTIS